MGMSRAFEPGVAKRFEDLVAWQLADELRARIVRFTSEPPIVYDAKYCSQVREAASSVPANIAEGFCRYGHRDFARFLSIARASLAETQVRLKDGADRLYLSQAELGELQVLARRAMIAITRLLTFLRTHPDVPQNPGRA
jgi:four helix bundle protein